VLTAAIAAASFAINISVLRERRRRAGLALEVALQLRPRLTGARVVARSPAGEETALETPELANLEGRGQALSSRELGLLAKKLAGARDPVEAARLKERIARGFYGSDVPHVRR